MDTRRMQFKADTINSLAWEIRRSDVKRAYTLATEALAIAEASSYKKGIAEALRTLGYTYWRFGDYQAAMERSLSAVKIFKDLHDKKGEADTINNIGAVYAFLKDHQNRLESNLACLRLRDEAGDEEGVAASLNNIGETYMEMGKTGEALSCFNRCLSHASANAQVKAWAYFNLSEHEFKRGNLPRAQNLVESCIEQAEKVRYHVLICAGYALHADISIREKDFSMAFDLLNKALAIAKEHELKEDAFKINRLFSDAYRSTGQTEKAFFYYKQYHLLKEKLYRENNAQNILNLQFRFESEALKKETEVERLRNVELRAAYDEIESQRSLLAAKNLLLEKKVKAVTHGIEYARTLQEAILPDAATIRELLREVFVFYQPKDIVSGDFYRIERINDTLIVGAFDCTGHGVPGALMGILGYNALTRAFNSTPDLDPGKILGSVSSTIVEVLNQYTADTEVKDGMDAAICCIDLDREILRFSGAFNGVWLVNELGITEIRGTREPIGGDTRRADKFFETREIKIRKGDMIYLGTDGYTDQFSARDGKKLKNSGLRKILMRIYDKPAEIQKQELAREFEAWKGSQEQIDDVCVIGVRLMQ